jgi:DNA-binding transcriptional ArsR family regulator
MKETKADIVLHPVRMRIVQTLINRKKLSAQLIGSILTDIPQATLYRHLNKLLEANVLTVVEENPVRGTVEKIYSLSTETASISAEDIANWSPEEHKNYFMKFITTVIADFERYVNQKEYDMEKDGAGYRQVSFYASDEEYIEFMKTLQQGVMKLIENEDNPTRRKRTLSTIITTENK